MGQPTPRLAASDADVRSCFAVMRQLRTYLTSEEDFLQRVRGLEEAQGYKLAFVSADNQVVAAAGYAYYSTMERADPRDLFVHDLVTAEAARGGGHGSALIRWLEAEARSHGCTRLVLDSNTERRQAHRFYHAHGLTIRSFHFAKDLSVTSS